MLTSRGYWLLLFLLLILAVALPFGQPLGILVPLTVLAWLAYGWVTFALAIEFSARRLTLERRIGDRRAGKVLLWAGQPTRVIVKVHAPGWFSLAHVLLEDRVPAWGHVSAPRGSSPKDPTPMPSPTSVKGVLASGSFLGIEYEYRHPIAGGIRFEGVSVEISDSFGLFRQRIFVRGLVEAIVLPNLAEEGRPRGTRKRDNLLPTRGIHRNLRPGSASELLELRDYQTGDPPKTIAWKVSARRDRLITKQFASDVPVRCTLMMDVSDSVRVGSPNATPLSHSIRVAAALAREMDAARDPVGLFLISDHDCQVLLPASGRRQLLRIHARLGEIAGAPMAPSHCPPSLLIEPAYRFCSEVYPDLLDDSINGSAPWWSRILDVVGNFYVVASLYAGLGGALLAWGSATAFTTLHWTLLAIYLFAGWWGWRRWSRWSLRLWGRAADGWTWTGNRRHRKRVSSVVAVLAGLGPAGVSRMVHDDAFFSREAQRFLLDHQVSYPRPLIGPSGEYLFSSRAKVEALRRALLRAVLHGRDNELYVLLFDLLEIRDAWPALFAALKVARARHHQVIVICPWPESLPRPPSTEWTDSLWPPRSADGRHWDATEYALRELDLLRHRSAFQDLKGELGKVGVPLLAAPTSESVLFVKKRLEQIRAARLLQTPVGPAR